MPGRLARCRPALLSLVLVILLIGLASSAVNAAPMPGGVYIGWVYVNGVSVSNFTIDVSLGPTYYWTEYYAANDTIGSYEMDITIPDEGVKTGDIVCTVPGVGTQTLHNVDLTKDNTTCNWYFTSATATTAAPTATATARPTAIIAATATSVPSTETSTTIAATSGPSAVISQAATVTSTASPTGAAGNSTCLPSLLLPLLAAGTVISGAISIKRTKNK